MWEASLCPCWRKSLQSQLQMKLLQKLPLFAQVVKASAHQTTPAVLHLMATSFIAVLLDTLVMRVCAKKPSWIILQQC